MATFGRYFLGLPGALFAALALYIQSRQIAASPFRAHAWYFLGASFLFGAYGIMGGVYVRPIDIFPANILNSDLFFRIFGFPVQIARAATATTAAILLVRGLTVYGHEVDVIFHRSLTDGLTGLYNHRFFMEKLSQEVDRARQAGKRVCVIMADLDHFKRFNDTYGHLAGDALLQRTAALLKKSVRHSDVVARYGGEEFAVLLADTDPETAYEVAERVRCSLQDHFCLGVVHAAPDRPATTISLGVACLPDDAETARDLLQRADEALYQAKKRRNMTARACHAEGAGSSPARV